MDLREFWLGKIVNMPNGFTMQELLNCRKRVKKSDMRTIHEILKDLGDSCLVTRRNNKFYLRNTEFNI